MQSSESLIKIAPAIAKAQAEFKAVPKSGDNKFDRYRYANLDDYVHATRDVLAKHGLSVLSSVEETFALDDRPTKAGGFEHAVRVKLAVRLVHESGEWIESQSWGEGQDRADKSVYKAITGARKYGLAAALGLATSDDPEADDTTGNTPANKQLKSPPPQNTGNGAATQAQNDELAETYTHEMRKRGITISEAGAAILDVLKKKKIQRLVDLPPDVRQAFTDAIRAGKFDKWGKALAKAERGDK